jgi:cysteine synthase
MPVPERREFIIEKEDAVIDLTINSATRDKTVQYCRQHKITLPTFAMMKDPQRVPGKIQERLRQTGLWEVHPVNLFRITWKNEPKDFGGLFSGVNHRVLPPELTGCRASIVVLIGKWFPTGAHKVGATFGCLIPRLVTGQFDPQQKKAVWPSTGNYCRGGAYISALLACRSIAILPEGMSRERFEWLQSVAGEVIATPGCESNVKEIFDKCRELRNSGEDLQIFNQFEELGNPLWHYAVTGNAAEEILQPYIAEGKSVAGFVASSGSSGTLGAGYYLKEKYPRSKLVVGEALQCPTLLHNGFGDHRIEGIGDKHVPWIHDCKQTDVVIAVDDEIPVRLLRFYNEDEGRKTLRAEGVSPQLVSELDLLGISGVGNLIAAVKFAKYCELTEDDLVVTVATDSMQLYGSRLRELSARRGPYTQADAQRDFELSRSLSIDYVKELNYYDRKSIHNLKYFTWIEQQGRDLQELNDQWYAHDRYWLKTFDQVDQIDALIEDFNDRVGAV